MTRDRGQTTANSGVVPANIMRSRLMGVSLARSGWGQMGPFEARIRKIPQDGGWVTARWGVGYRKARGGLYRKARCGSTAKWGVTVPQNEVWFYRKLRVVYDL